MHDVGKISVADAILEKLGPLTEEEWALIKRHPEVGARMIEPIESLSGALPVIRHHHERSDGSGYPDGLEGDEIPLGARIVAAVDAYDVMLWGRPYRTNRNRPDERYGPRIRPQKLLRSWHVRRGVSSMCGWSRRWSGRWAIQSHRRVTRRELISFLLKGRQSVKAGQTHGTGSWSSRWRGQAFSLSKHRSRLVGSGLCGLSRRHELRLGGVLQSSHDPHRLSQPVLILTHHTGPFRGSAVVPTDLIYLRRAPKRCLICIYGHRSSFIHLSVWNFTFHALHGSNLPHSGKALGRRGGAARDLEKG